MHATNRWQLPVLMAGILLASGRRTVTTWLRAAGVSDDYQDNYYFLAAVGRESESIATQLVGLVLRTLPLPDRLLLVIDGSPTKRYGSKVRTCITIPLPDRPISRFCTATSGLRFRLLSRTPPSVKRQSEAVRVTAVGNCNTAKCGCDTPPLETAARRCSRCHPHSGARAV